MERSLFGITARLRSVPVETSSRLSRKSILPACDGLVSPLSVTCTGLAVSRELGLQRLAALVDHLFGDSTGLDKVQPAIEFPLGEFRFRPRIGKLAVRLFRDGFERARVDHVEQIAGMNHVAVLELDTGDEAAD